MRLPGSSASSEAHDLVKEVWRINKDEIMTSYSLMRYFLTILPLQKYLEILFLVALGHHWIVQYTLQKSWSIYYWRFNLVQLFVQSAQSSQLRKIIVDLEVSINYEAWWFWKILRFLPNMGLRMHIPCRLPDLTVDVYLVKILLYRISGQRRI